MTSRRQRFKQWWGTASSSVWVHKRLKWLWIFPGVPISMVLRESVPYLVAISVYAIVVGHWSSQEAAESAMVGRREMTDVMLRIEKAVGAAPAPGSSAEGLSSES